MSLEDKVNKQEIKFNKDYNIYYESLMSKRKNYRAPKMYEELKIKYKKTDEDMGIKLYNHMRDIQLKYDPDVFKRRE